MPAKKMNESTLPQGCSTVWNVLHLAAQGISSDRERDNVRYDAEEHRDALISGVEMLGTLISDSAFRYQYNQCEIVSIGDFMKSAATLINGMNSLIAGCDELNGKR